MSSAALSHARVEREKLQERISRIKRDHKNAIRETVGAGITVATAFGVGYMEGRYPSYSNLIGSLPLSLVAGGALLTMAGLEVGGAEQAAYIGDAGRGCLAAWAAGSGGAFGREGLEKSKQTTGTPA